MVHQPAATASPGSLLETQHQTLPQTCPIRICILTSPLPNIHRHKKVRAGIGVLFQLLPSVSLKLNCKLFYFKELEAQLLEERPGFGGPLGFLVFAAMGEVWARVFSKGKSNSCQRKCFLQHPGMPQPAEAKGFLSASLQGCRLGCLVPGAPAQQPHTSCLRRLC